MDIVHASGAFYRQFEVLVWVPWVLLDEVELEAQLEQAAAETGEDRPLTTQFSVEISDLYYQFKRGWILRESNPMCKPLMSEKTRNIAYLEKVEVNRSFDSKSKSFKL